MKGKKTLAILVAIVASGMMIFPQVTSAASINQSDAAQACPLKWRNYLKQGFAGHYGYKLTHVTCPAEGTHAKAKCLDAQGDVQMRYGGNANDVGDSSTAGCTKRYYLYQAWIVKNGRAILEYQRGGNTSAPS